MHRATFAAPDALRQIPARLRGRWEGTRLGQGGGRGRVGSAAGRAPALARRQRRDTSGVAAHGSCRLRQVCMSRAVKRRCVPLQLHSHQRWSPRKSSIPSAVAVVEAREIAGDPGPRLNSSMPREQGIEDMLAEALRRRDVVWRFVFDGVRDERGLTTSSVTLLLEGFDDADE